MPDQEDSYGEAIKLRVAALEKIFGEHTAYLGSPIPFYLDGRPTILEFGNHLPNANVYCTSEMTGTWGSGQKPGSNGEYELVMVCPKDSPLNPKVDEPPVVKQGFVGMFLSDIARYSTKAKLAHGHTMGPLDGRVAPMRHILFINLTNPKVPFAFGGRTYGLLLLMLITENEHLHSQKHGSNDLISKLRTSKAFPLSDLRRKPVV